MKNLVIRFAKREDCREIRRLIQELADFEKCSDGPKLDVDTLQRDGFDSDPPKFHCLVAEVEPFNLCGFALYFPTYSTWEGKALRLEDIYVSPSHRGRGLGRLLFNRVAKEAHIGGCCRIDFSVLSWNPATEFYKKLGAEDISASESWNMWRLGKEGIAAAAHLVDSQTS